MRFAELDDRAKERAREGYRAGSLDYDWWDCVYEDAVTVLGYLGFDATKTEFNRDGTGTHLEPTIRFSGFYSQGDGASFTGDWAAARVDLGKLLEHAPEDETLRSIGTRITALVLRWPQATCEIVRIGSRYSHSGTMGWDEARLHPEVEYYDSVPATEEFGYELRDLARELANWIYAQLEQEYDYLMSDEVVDEGIEANEYDFEEDGQVA